MRQLVSVVTEQTVSYFLAEDGSDQVHQVAQVMNTGLEVGDVIDLGANLLDALKLNGHRKVVGAPATSAIQRALREPEPAQPELIPAPAKPKSKPRKPTGQPPGRPRGPSPRPIQRWGFTRERVLEDLEAHPGTTYWEAVERITGGMEERARQAYSSSLQLAERTLLGTGMHVRREQFTAEMDGTNRVFARLFLEPEPPRPARPAPPQSAPQEEPAALELGS